MDDLVKSLRQHHYRATLAGLEICVFIEAADRIATLEAELSKAREREQRLQAALAFWMPGVTDSIEVELNGRAGDDAQLLVGFEGEVPQTSWGDVVLGRIGKAREAALEEAAKVAECHFDDRGNGRSGHHREMDWTDGYRDATRGVAAAIRSLSKKEG